MPLVHSTYRAPAPLPGGHLQTIWPALFRRSPLLNPSPERLELPDGDFLDLESFRAGNPRLAILSHGLEGSSRATYIRTMAAALLSHEWDVLAWNFRGCGTESNRLLTFYHSGLTSDLDAVIRHAIDRDPTPPIDLIGFSLGGNLTLKYLGESSALPTQIHRAVAISVPCDLASSSARLSSFDNRIYMRRFLKTLRAKVIAKGDRFPGQLDLADIENIRTFQHFDDRFTGPLHGFHDAADYWTRCSSRPFIPAIHHPTLLINALNDPFLGPECFPRAEAETHPFFHLETPAAGGHVGFPSAPPGWLEKRTIEFLSAP